MGFGTLHADLVAVLEGFWCEHKLLRKDTHEQSVFIVSLENPKIMILYACMCICMYVCLHVLEIYMYLNNHLKCFPT